MYEKWYFRALKGILWSLAGEIICFVFILCFFVPMQKFMLARIFAGLATLVLVNGLYFNFAYKCAQKDKNAVKYHSAERDPRAGLFMALTAPLGQYVLWIILLLSKLGAISDFVGKYLLLNIQCLPWYDLFTDNRTIDHLAPAGLAGLLLLTLISPAVIYITYELTYREIDVKAILMYGKNKGGTDRD